MAVRFDRLAALAEKRYVEGHPFIIKSTGTPVDGVMEYETDDGRLAIAANQAIGKMLGMDEPVKIAPTSPDGEEPYQSLTDDELKRQVGEILGVPQGK